MRPGLIIGGQCVMAPGALDVENRPGDGWFAQRAGGLQVTVNGGVPLGAVVAYDERAGWVRTLDGTVHCGRVQALPVT